MKEEISARFEANLARVGHFLTTYDDLRRDMVDAGLREDPRGRATVAEGDLLRAAVVFLHASLEDLIRSLVSSRFLDHAAPDAFSQVPLADTSGRATKFDLSHLVAHRAATVDDLLRRCVDQWLEKSNYNHVRDLRAALVSVKLDEKLVDQFAPYLQPMIERRHWIVHRADRNVMGGRGHQSARTISAATVRRWAEKVGAFGRAVLSTT